MHQQSFPPQRRQNAPDGDVLGDILREGGKQISNEGSLSAGDQQMLRQIIGLCFG